MQTRKWVGSRCACGQQVCTIITIERVTIDVEHAERDAAIDAIGEPDGSSQCAPAAVSYLAHGKGQLRQSTL
jgi:hypothetical protein